MIMKTTKEMIEVMQSYLRGEIIVTHYLYDPKDYWITCGTPIWDWNNFDYRVKPKTKYVPFDTAEEFLAAQRLHGDRLISTYFIEPLKFNDIYINADGIVLIRTKDECGADFDYFGDLKDLFKKFKFSDGTPCGKEVEL